MATTNMLPWNPTAANQETDAAYLADSQRAGGATDPSLFASVLANKAFYQWSTYLTALFTAFAAKGYTTSDSNLATLTAQCANFLTSADILPPLQLVAFASTVSLNAAAANGFYLEALTGNIAISAVTGLTSGQPLGMFYQQDATGGRTVSFAAVFEGALQPDPAPNAVSFQPFKYDPVTSILRAAGPLISNNGAWFPAALATTGAVTAGSLIAGSLIYSTAPPLGATLIWNGSSFQAKSLTFSNSTSHTFNTQYQNNSGAEMTVAVTANQGSSGGAMTAYIGPSSATIFAVATSRVPAADSDPVEVCGLTFKVPVGWYYQVNEFNLNFTNWSEWTWQ